MHDALDLNRVREQTLFEPPQQCAPQVISNVRTLRVKGVGLRRLTEVHAAQLFPKLGSNFTGVQELHLCDHWLRDEGVSLLARELPYFTRLLALSLASNQITARGAGMLGKVLCTLRGHGVSLESLNLSDNSLEDEGVAVLAESLCLGCPLLQQLTLRNVGLTHRASSHLARMLTTCGTVRDLHLGDNPLGDAGIACLAKALGESTSLRSLVLCNTLTGVEGAHDLARWLPGSPCLSVLDLSNNELGLEGVGQLAPSLGRCAALTELMLRCCFLGNRGVGRLALALRSCRNLQALPPPLETRLSLWHRWVGTIRYHV